MRSSYALPTTRNVHVSESVHSVGAIARGSVGTGLCMVGVPGDDGPERSTGGRVAAGDCVLIRSGEEYAALSRRPFRALTVVLFQSRLEQAFEMTWGVSLRALAPGCRLGLADPSTRRWLHQEFHALVSPAGGEEGIGGLRRGTDAETEGAIVDTLVRAARPIPARRRDPSRQVFARRAERTLRDGLAEDMSITSYASQLGTTLRTLELGFREVYGISLRQYRHSLRLNAARRDLLRRDGEDSVGMVAVRWGLYHLGRFSTEYRRMFGESPSETHRTARRGREAAK